MTVLRDGPLTVRLRPEGGRIAALHHDLHGDLIVPMTDAPFDPEFWPKAGAYPLIPFHNRIAGGRFDWDGQPYALPLHPAEPNALHGFASRPDWRIEGARMVLEHSADDLWPWDLTAVQDITLTDTALEIAMSVTNRSARTMPAGFGWHPFFPPCRVEDDAALAWPAGPDMMPLGHSRAKGEDSPTRHLSDWSAAIVTLSGGARLRLRGSAELSHLVVHETPDYACIEPVSHLAGALTLQPVRMQDRMRSLAPGATLRGTVTLEVL
ncbi:aldose epimerase family protein [Falsirhodobacter xinxiangensis]|uniref:aldose epimerase family protein n=1 Tax=Falsirhodobacter xinxiangensis TaxID=2530049 RepID=UPI0010AAC2EA|nr:hypothetical protein [Rhodobacter xinxiangensis]